VLRQPSPSDPPLTDGEAAFTAIYGRAADKVRGRIGACHPLLISRVLNFVYADVMSTPGPEPRERELCAVAVLAGGGAGTEPLLISHCRGALRVGASKDELRAILDHTEHVHGADCAERSKAVWYTFERARAML
jgi:alkylhydroperoxidase/carboxymuconolactone decarboxylase family protein YurZ